MQRTSNTTVVRKKMTLITYSSCTKTDATIILRTTRSELNVFIYVRRSCFVVLLDVLQGKIHSTHKLLRSNVQTTRTKYQVPVLLREWKYIAFIPVVPKNINKNSTECLEVLMSRRKTFTPDFKIITLTRSSFKTDFLMLSRMLMLFYFHISNLRRAYPSS